LEGAVAIYEGKIVREPPGNSSVRKTGGKKKELTGNAGGIPPAETVLKKKRRIPPLRPGELLRFRGCAG